MLKDQFLLDPDVIFLNHGSFGACPRPVFEAYQAWQRRLEEQPVLFLDRQFARLHETARRALGDYLGAGPNDLVYLPNATHGVNIVARTLHLDPGDEILTCDHEYGACDKTWEFICHKTGARYIRQAISLPLESEQAFVERLWQAVTPRTKLIFLSHITSPTAQRFPIEALCWRARQEGILTLIDGAHAPGQITLDLENLGADFYTGNCHKWLLSPKGAAFLYTRPERQELIEPLVVSWGYQADESFSSGSRYIDLLQWTGTADPSAALSVPAAIEFMQAHDWETLRQGCSQLLRQALERIGELTGLPSPYPYEVGPAFQALPPQIGIAPLPYIADLRALKSRLYDEFSIEIPLIEWDSRHFVRISVQVYNTQADIEALVAALQVLLSTAGRE